MMADNPYPRFMYRHHPAADWVDGVPCEILQVLDADEEKAAKTDGWHDNVADAAPKLKTKAEPKATDDDLRPTLRAQYEALSGKKAFGGWSAEQLQEKIAGLEAK